MYSVETLTRETLQANYICFSDTRPSAQRHFLVVTADANGRLLTPI